jgi:hypothetical protein
LNPYAAKGPLLKLEDVNFKLANGAPTKETGSLYCFAVSAKRYALFNLTADEQITMRKASAHGLGHLLPPYSESEAPASIPGPAVPLSEIGAERWQYDLWHQIIRAALDGDPDQVDLRYHANLDLPAASRYGATTPNLVSWFDKYNDGLPYSDQVRPSNFMLAFQISPLAIQQYPELLESIAGDDASRPKPVKLPKPVAPFDRHPAKAAEACFDRDTGMAIPIRVLKTYKDALAQYHLRPEHKFANGNYTNRGTTRRRHARPAVIRNIGKESNRWEEKFYLGFSEEKQVEYGLAPNDLKGFLGALRTEIRTTGQRKVAAESGTSRRTIARIMQGKSVRKTVAAKIIGVLRTRKK